MVAPELVVGAWLSALPHSGDIFGSYSIIIHAASHTPLTGGGTRMFSLPNEVIHPQCAPRPSNRVPTGRLGGPHHPLPSQARKNTVPPPPELRPPRLLFETLDAQLAHFRGAVSDERRGSPLQIFFW